MATPGASPGSLTGRSRKGTLHKFSGDLQLVTWPHEANNDFHANSPDYGYPPRPGRSSEDQARWDKLLGQPLRHIQPEFIERPLPPTRPLLRGSAGGVAGPSPNWSGVELFASRDRRLLSVAGQWTVPSVQIPYPLKGMTNLIACVWVGIDGDGSPDVFQAGVVCGIVGDIIGIPGEEIGYGAWFEWWPHLWVNISNFKVSPGDVMTCLLVANDDFQTLRFDAATALEEQPAAAGTWLMGDYDKDGKADLVFLKTANTQSGKVEIQIASAKSEYQEIILGGQTAFDEPPAGAGMWLMADYDKDGKADLVFLKTANTQSGNVEIQIASAKSKYKNIILDGKTAFPEPAAGAGTWLMGDYDKDGKADLCFLQTANTQNGKVEIQIASAKSKYQQVILNGPTAFAEQPAANVTWLMGDWDKDGKADLAFVQTANTASGKVEISIASAKSNYTDVILQTPTIFAEQTNPGAWFLADSDDDKVADLAFVQTANTPTRKAVLSIADGNPGQTGNIVFRNETRGISTAFEFKAPKGTTLVGNVAEWIVERPQWDSGVSTGLAVLPNYELAVFTEATATDNMGTVIPASQGLTEVMVDGALTISTGSLNSAGDVVCVYTGRGSTFQHLILSTPTAFDTPAPDTGTWCMADCDKDGKADLVFIKTANTPGGKVELHILSAKSNYQNFIVQTPTAFDLQPAGTGTWIMADCDKDGKADLVFVKTANTPGGKVELYVASAKSNYQTLIVQTQTAFDLQPPGTGIWAMGDYDKDGKADLVFIKTANTPSGKVEVHIASAKSNYQNLVLQTATSFDLQPPGTGAWLIADYGSSNKAALMFIQTFNTTILDGMVEINVLSAKSKYQTLILRIPTIFPVPNGGGSWFVADYQKAGTPDLIFLKTVNTNSGKVEIEVAAGNFSG